MVSLDSFWRRRRESTRAETNLGRSSKHDHGLGKEARERSGGKGGSARVAARSLEGSTTHPRISIRNGSIVVEEVERLGFVGEDEVNEGDGICERKRGEKEGRRVSRCSFASLVNNKLTVPLSRVSGCSEVKVRLVVQV